MKRKRKEKEKEEQEVGDEGKVEKSPQEGGGLPLCTMRVHTQGYVV